MAAPNDPMARMIQEALPHLQLIRREAIGGMGEIYLGRDPDLRRTLAIKVLHADLSARSTARDAFLKEARVIASIAHPNVIAIHSVGELADSTPFYTMEYVPGGSLAERIPSDGIASIREARRIIGSIASALAEAHRAGVVHRDVKPANVLYAMDSGEPKLTDWGIAATWAEPSESPLPPESEVSGTPGWMSPEQMDGIPSTPASDMYSLGALAYKVLTGRAPFTGSTVPAILAAQLRNEPDRLFTVRPDIDPELAGLVHRCLLLDPRKRPSAREVSTRLGAGKRGAVEWPPPGLDSLIGAGSPLVRQFSMSLVIATAAAILLMVAGELRTEDATLYLTLAAAVIAGGLAIVVNALRMIPLAVEVRRARAMGYDFRTVLDVVSDTRGDTGALLSGATTYGALSARARGMLLLVRRWTLIGPALLGLAAALVMSVVVLRGPPPFLGALSLGGIACLMFIWMLSLWERLATSQVRSKTSSPQTRPLDLTDVWYGSLDALNLDRSRPRPGRIQAYLLLLLPLTVGAAMLIAIVLPALVVGLNGRFADAYLAELLDQIDLEADIADELVEWRYLILPVTGGENAGLLMWSALVSVSDTLQDGRSSPLSLPRWSHPSSASGLLEAFGARSVQTGAVTSPTTSRLTSLEDSLFALGASGLTAEQELWLESLSEEPALAALSQAARTQQISLSMAMWDSATFVQRALSGVGSGMPAGWETLWTAKELQATLRLHQGRSDLAEELLLELITIAFKLADADPLWGRHAVREASRGFRRLLVLRRATGDLGDDRSVELEASLARIASARARRPMGPDQLSDVVTRAADRLNQNVRVRTHRYELARAAALSSRCGSVIAVAAGPDEDASRFLAERRREAGDDLLSETYWAMFVEDEPPDSVIRNALHDTGRTPPLTARMIPRWSSQLAAAMGNPRIRGCRWVLSLADLYVR